MDRVGISTQCRETVIHHSFLVGKSSMISILTGLVKKTTGKVTIYDLDLDSELSKISHITGIW